MTRHWKSTLTGKAFLITCNIRLTFNLMEEIFVQGLQLHKKVDKNKSGLSLFLRFKLCRREATRKRSFLKTQSHYRASQYATDLSGNMK